MLKYIKKHQKKFMAIFSVGLMISFAAVGKLNPRGAGEIVQGHIGTRDVTSAEFQQAANEWQVLNKSLIMRDENSGRAMPFAAQLGLGGPWYWMQAEPHPGYYYLLLEDARAMLAGAAGGADMERVLVSDEEVKQMMDELEISAPERNREEIEANEPEVVRHALMVQKAMLLAMAGVKVTAPELENNLAQGDQEVSLALVEFPAQMFMPSTAPTTSPAPLITETEVNQQFEKYKNKDPNDPEDNPMRMGYRHPNKVALDFIALRKADVTKVVQRAVTATDAFGYYKEHPTEFQSKVPATQQTLSIDTSVQVAVKPFDDPDVRKVCFNKATGQKVAEETATIVKAMRQQILQDYDAYKSAIAAAGPAAKLDAAEAGPVTRFGVHYGSYEYFEKLAWQIEHDYHVLPETGHVGELQSAKELRANPTVQDVAKTRPEEGTTRPELIDYATTFVAPLNPLRTPPDLALLAIMEPSIPMEDGGEATCIFRVTKAEAAHAANRWDQGITERVEADLKLNKAQALAHDRATRFMEDAAKAHLNLQQAAEAAGMPSQVTGLFNFEAARGTIPGYALDNPEAALQIVRQAIGLLQGAAPGSHPLAVVDLPGAGKVLVVQLDEVKPMWSKETRPYVEQYEKMRMLQSLRSGFARQWFKYEDVAARLGYKAEEKKGAKQEIPSPNHQPQEPVGSPF